ncbi:MAG: tail fiber domain-containing protein [Candidatus Scalindua sp.]|nr:tail fiber domain-containing protein [Candidatus Scalindua sp.]
MGKLVDDLPLIGGGGDDGKKASQRAAAQQVAGQTEALEYLKEREALPQQYREQALTGLADLYLSDDPAAQQALIERAESSPLYQQQLANIDQYRMQSGRDISAQSAAGGKLYSGDLRDELGRRDLKSAQLQNQALTQSYNQQLQGLSGLGQLPSIAPQIAQGYSDIGATRAAGTLGAYQSQQSGQQAGLSNLGGIASLVMQGYSTFSDRRLKDNIAKIGEKDGLNWYSWTWNEKAKDLGLEGEGEGFLADEVELLYPHLVIEKEGYKFIEGSNV